MRYVALLAVSLALAACQSAEERKAEWVRFCQAGEFSAPQCEVLYSMKQASDAASADAALGVGLAVGAAASGGARR